MPLVDVFGKDDKEAPEQTELTGLKIGTVN